MVNTGFEPPKNSGTIILLEFCLVQISIGILVCIVKHISRCTIALQNQCHQQTQHPHRTEISHNLRRLQLQQRKGENETRYYYFTRYISRI